MRNNTVLTGRDLNRRDFLGLLLLSSAVFLFPSGENAAATLPFAVLRELAPGEVRPGGWLRLRLEKQAAELGSKLPQVSWPFTGDYWKGEEKDDSIKKGQDWFPWEQKAYWIDGATRLGLVLGDQKLLEQVSSTIAYTLQHADADGYLGPELFKEPESANHRWPQAVFFRSLAACADGDAPLPGVTGKDIAAAMQKHYLNDKASYATPERNVTNIESMLWCYAQTGDPQLLALAENAWRGFMPVAGDPIHGDLSPGPVFADTHINSHGVTYAETIKLPAILYLYTGNEEYLRFAEAAERRIFDHHMLIDGIPSTSEWYSTRTSLDLHETCDIADHTWSWGYQLMATGDAVWADRIERACFNAAPGAIKNDWKAVQYMSCPNQFLATLHSDHHPKGRGGFKMAYQPNPGKRIACCGGNVHRIFPNYAIRMWMQTDDGGLTAVLYGPSKVKASVGANKDSIEIEQTTQYPFEEEIRFTVQAVRPVTFPLSLRVPGWCSRPQLAINGVPERVSRSAKGFLRVQRTFNPGDVIVLALPMKTSVTRWPQGGIGVEHGPLVYSLPIAGDWKPVVEERYTTPEYPSWEVTALSDWNYGLVVQESHPTSGIHFQRREHQGPGNFDPWETPPVALTVSARKIADWKLQVDPSHGNQQFTPPLPPTRDRARAENKVEQLTLVPYGSTELRVTIFPEITS